MKTKCIITFGVFLLVLMAGRAFAGVTPTTRYVGCEWGSPNYDYIQDAVNDSHPWDTIIVCPGCYPEDVLIAQNDWGTVLDGLTIKSKEVGSCGPGTVVGRFQIGFPAECPAFGPTHVTIAGFNVDCGLVMNNGVGIEVATSWNNLHHNFVYNCFGDPAAAGIRLDKCTEGNNVHQDRVEDSTNGIKLEEESGFPSADHNIHQNCASCEGGGCYGIWVQADSSLIHQNWVPDYGLAGIQIAGDYNKVFKNEVCHVDGGNPFFFPGIYLFFQSDNNNVYKNTTTSIIRDDSTDSTNREKKNKENVSECPFDGCSICAESEFVCAD
jgi:hypothetical protein